MTRRLKFNMAAILLGLCLVAGLSGLARAQTEKILDLTGEWATKGPLCAFIYDLIADANGQIDIKYKYYKHIKTIPGIDLGPCSTALKEIHMKASGRNLSGVVVSGGRLANCNFSFKEEPATGRIAPDWNAFTVIMSNTGQQMDVRTCSRLNTEQRGKSSRQFTRHR